MQTEGQELGPYSPVSDELVLAAVERAVLHREREGVPHSDIAEHLGFLHAAATTRKLRPQLVSLHDAGQLERSRRHGMDLWGLSASGRRRLAAARKNGELEPLPESPQHRRWRHAHEEASARYDELRTLLYETLEAAEETLETAVEPGSEELFALGERLGAAFWLLGSATHCRDEWPEPEDSRPDRDEPDARRGRRIVGGWKTYEKRAKGEING